MLRILLNGCELALQRRNFARPQVSRSPPLLAFISTNTAINKSLRRSQYESKRPERRLPSRGGGYGRASDGSVTPRVQRNPGQAGHLARSSPRPGSPQARSSPGRVGVYDNILHPPESTRSRVRRRDHQQGRDGEDLTEAQMIQKSYGKLERDRKIPRSISSRTTVVVEKRARVNEVARRSQYDYTSKPGGNRALRRAAKFGQNLESLEVEPLRARPKSPRPTLQRDTLRSFNPQEARGARRETRSNSSERKQSFIRSTHGFEQDTEEIDNFSIPEDLRDDDRSFLEPRRRSFTMGRQDLSKGRTSFSSGERGFNNETQASSHNQAFDRRGRSSPRDDEYKAADKRSNVPLSIPYTTPASEFLYGTSVVTAALLSSRRKLYKLYIYGGENREARDQDNRIRNLALSRDVVVERVKGDWLRLLDKMSMGRPHNGYILEASPLPRLPVTGLQRVSRPQGPLHVVLDHQSREDEDINGRDTHIRYDVGFPRYPIVLLLDGILDPGNLGAILRTAFFLGVDAVAIANRSSAPLSSVALKASAGASESLPLMSVTQPGSFIDSCQYHGWKVYAAAAPSPHQRSGVGKYLSTSGIGNSILEQPCLLVLGGEGEGLRWNIQQKADFEVGIAGQRIGKGGVDSLNVSVAAGLLCEAFLRKPVGLPKTYAGSPSKNVKGYDGMSHNVDTNVEDRLF